MYKDGIVDFYNFEEFLLGKKIKPTKPPSRLLLAKIDVAENRKIMPTESEADDVSVDSRKIMRENPHVDAYIAETKCCSCKTVHSRNSKTLHFYTFAVFDSNCVFNVHFSNNTFSKYSWNPKESS